MTPGAARQGRTFSVRFFGKLGGTACAISVQIPLVSKFDDLQDKDNLMRLAPRLLPLAAIAAAAGLLASAAHAADWSDTSIGFRSGDKFAEPFNTIAPNGIHKDIVDLNHVSGYKYGSNFFNVDLLMSNSKDPSSVGPDFKPQGSAQEIYIVYRNTVDLEKLAGVPMKMGPVRGYGLSFGFDVNAKTDAGYNSKKRMLVVGPTLNLDVPGFLSVSLLALLESNAPCSDFNLAAGKSPCTSRFRYDTHPMLNAAWGIPLGKDSGFSFEGFANFIASKGKNEFGADTAAETNIDGQIMYDVGMLTGTKGKFKVGFEYQYWKNKFGNKTTAVGGGAGPGATAKTPMLRGEYHF